MPSYYYYYYLACTRYCRVPRDIQYLALHCISLSVRALAGRQLAIIQTNLGADANALTAPLSHTSFRLVLSYIQYYRSYSSKQHLLLQVPIR